MRSVLFYIFFFLLPQAVGAQALLPERPDLIQTATQTGLKDAKHSYSTPLPLHFRQGGSLIESGYMQNAVTLSAFHLLLSDSLSASRIDTILIIGNASPEGNELYNSDLAKLRAGAMKEYLIREYPHLEQQRILARSQGEDWTGFRCLIEEDDCIPDREDVLQILEEVSDSNRRKMLLKKLNCGYAYQYIYNQILPKLRNATFCTVKINKRSANKEILSCTSESKTRFSMYSKESGYCSTSVMTNNNKTLNSYATSMNTPGCSPVFRPAFALKTNLLFDLATAPNIEFEFLLGNRWSVNAEWIFPWWLYDNNKYCLQVLSGGAEVRYWLGNRNTHRLLTGHFLGLYAGGGKYDLQWKESGYQGEFYIASGISYGYSTPIARRLNLEFCLGIGLLRTHYRHYHTIDDYQTLLWQNNGTYTWFGPTKVKISLVWLLGGSMQKGGKR